MARPKIYRKSLTLCNKCEYFERKVGFKYRCGIEVNDGNRTYCPHKFMDLDKFLKREEDTCKYKVEHQLMIFNNDFKETKE